MADLVGFKVYLFANYELMLIFNMHHFVVSRDK